MLPDATDILSQLRSGSLSAAALVEQQLERLAAVQGTLNASTEILADEARRAAAHPAPGPLSGLPVTLKETIGLAGRPITAGSLRMQPETPAADAVVVQRLRAAGAIVIARSNVPEFAMTGETTNPRFGRTNNPLDPSRVAGGSTGGEGALVGSGASLAGIGSDILGSIRIPASFCGIVGFKPSSQAVDKRGTWPRIDGYTNGWLALGPLTRSVRDARLLYDVIANTPAAAPAPVAGLRLLAPDHFPFEIDDPCIGAAHAAALQALTAAGMQAERPAFPDVERLYVRAADLILHDCEPGWHAMLSPAAGEPFSVWREALRQATGRGEIDSGLFTWLLHGATLGRLTKPRGERQLARLTGMFDAARDHYRALLGTDGILVLPTMGMLAPRHGAMNRKTLKPGVNRRMTPLTFANYCDLPAISVPAWDHADSATGLAPGILLLCAPGAEGRLLDAAAVVEGAIDSQRSTRRRDSAGHSAAVPA
ncbi:MAG TPA: amidase [Telluria sp.]|nr:amidase [Telluria sp.]